MQNTVFLTASNTDALFFRVHHWVGQICGLWMSIFVICVSYFRQRSRVTTIQH